MDPCRSVTIYLAHLIDNLLNLVFVDAFHSSLLICEDRIRVLPSGSIAFTGFVSAAYAFLLHFLVILSDRMVWTDAGIK